MNRKDVYYHKMFELVYTEKNNLTFITGLFDLQGDIIEDKMLSRGDVHDLLLMIDNLITENL